MIKGGPYRPCSGAGGSRRVERRGVGDAGVVVVEHRQHALGRPDTGLTQSVPVHVERVHERRRLVLRPPRRPCDGREESDSHTAAG